MKFSLFLSIFFLLACFCGCSPPPPVNIYDLYESGKFPTTLSKNNCYKLTNAENAIALAHSPEPVLIFIGGTWCPYCAEDIGIVDSVFQSSSLSQMGTIYYIDVADSQISASTVMMFNEAFDETVPPKIPCVMYFRGGKLIANRNDPAFKQTDSRMEQLRLFFEFIETN